MKTGLKELHIEINHKCNLACLMCNHRFDANQNAQINKENFTSVISSSAFKNLELLSISGGEPTLHEDFDFILKNAVETLEDAQILILSNLTHSDRLFIALKNLKPEQLSKIHIGSSLDGPREIHNKIRRNDEAFDKLMTNFLELKKNFENLSAGCTFTITGLNYHLLFETYKLCKEKLKANLGLQLLIPYNTNNDKEVLLKKDHFPFIAEQIKMIIDDIMNDEPENCLYSLSDRSYLRALCDYFESGNKKKSLCGAGRDFLLVNPEGSVYLCPLQKEVIFGNIKKDNLDDISKTSSETCKTISQEICKNCFLRCSFSLL